jgi:uncharacterized membrane protein
MNPLTATKKELKENLDLVQKLGKQGYEYAELKLIRQLSTATSSIAIKSLFGIFAISSLLFISIALSLVIGEALASIPLGFLIVAAGHLLLAVGVFLVRKKIKKYVLNQIATKYFSKKTFQSVDHFENELKRKDLEHQISREQLKLNYNRLQNRFTLPILKTTALSFLTKIGIGYLKKRLIK